jgi:formylglycine-generating enzyme required for sulfatase activity
MRGTEQPDRPSGGRLALWLAGGIAVLCLIAAIVWIVQFDEDPDERTARAGRTDTASPQDDGDLRTRQGERDCATCPAMLRVPEGGFSLGSPAGDADRSANEGPQQAVTFARPFWLAKFEVTRGEFQAFVDATGHPVSPTWNNPSHDPRFVQTDRHPVVNVTWEDAQAYVEWLRRTTGRNYRLPSEAEWEYAVRATTTMARFWGSDRKEMCRHANVADQTFLEALKGSRTDIAPCMDGQVYTAPVGSYQPNAWGFQDMLGNVMEWTADCWNESLAGTPANGEARQSGDCDFRVARGGSWLTPEKGVRAAARYRQRAGAFVNNFGFRVARDD